MKYKLNKFGLSLAVLLAVAFSSLSIADNTAKGSTEMADKAAAVAKIKAYFDFKHPENWQSTGVVEYNQGFDTFRGLIKVTHKDSKKVLVYVVPLNLSLQGGKVEMVDKAEPEVEEVKKVEEVK